MSAWGPPSYRVGPNRDKRQPAGGTLDGMTVDAPLGPEILVPVRGGLEAEDPEDLPPTAVMDNVADSTEDGE